MNKGNSYETKTIWKALNMPEGGMMPIHIPEGNYLTVKEAGQIKGVSFETVRKWIDGGQLKALLIPKLGHIINEAALLDFVPRRVGRPSKEMK